MRIPEVELLTADLSAQRYEFTQDGRIKLESKDETRKWAGHSPDRSDAVALALGSVMVYVEPIEVVYDPDVYGPFGSPDDGPLVGGW